MRRRSWSCEKERRAHGFGPASDAHLRVPATYRYTCRIACRAGGTLLNHVLRTHDTMMRISMIAASLALVIAASTAFPQDPHPPAADIASAPAAATAPAPAATP